MPKTMSSQLGTLGRPRRPGALRRCGPAGSSSTRWPTGSTDRTGSAGSPPLRLCRLLRLGRRGRGTVEPDVGGVLAVGRRRGRELGRVDGELLERQGVGPGQVLAGGVRRRRAAPPTAAAVAVLTHRRHEVDRLVGLAGPRPEALDAAVGVHVVDVEPLARGSAVRGRDDARGGVLAEPAGLVVGGSDRPREGLVGPGGGAPAATGREGHRQVPDAVLVAGRVPLDPVALDPAPTEPLGDALLEGHRRRAARPDRADPGPAGDVLALGEDRALELAHLLDAPPGAVGDLLGGEPAPDERLDVAWAHPALHLDLQLAEPGPVAAGRGPQRLVEGEAVPRAVGVREQEVLTGVVDADEAKIVHVGLPGVLVVLPDDATGRRPKRGAHAGGAPIGRIPWAP